MAIGEEMFSGGQEGGEGGQGNSRNVCGESSHRRTGKGAGLGQIVRVESRERILPNRP